MGSRLHPNYRSYFDRFINRREENEEAEKSGVKPSWLSTDPPFPEERRAKAELLNNWGPCAKPHLEPAFPLKKSKKRIQAKGEASQQPQAAVEGGGSAEDEA